MEKKYVMIFAVFSNFILNAQSYTFLKKTVSTSTFSVSTFHVILSEKQNKDCLLFRSTICQGQIIDRFTVSYLESFDNNYIVEKLFK